MKKYRLCKDCVNFLEHEKGKVFCDYDYWDEVKKAKAMIYCPEMWDCDKFEDIKKLK